MEKAGNKEEIISCIDNFVEKNIKRGNTDLEQQINELG